MTENSNFNHFNDDAKNKKSKKPIILIIIGLLLLSFAGCSAYMLFNNNSGGGASLGTYDNKTQEEIMAELNKKAKESMMTISLDITPTLSKDSKKLNVRVENTKDNKFDQIITVEQNDKVIGTYEGLKPGEKLDYIDVKDCKIGKANVIIQAMKDGKPSGNASSFEVEINQK